MYSVSAFLLEKIKEGNMPIKEVIAGVLILFVTHNCPRLVPESG